MGSSQCSLSLFVPVPVQVQCGSDGHCARRPLFIPPADGATRADHQPSKANTPPTRASEAIRTLKVLAITRPP